MAARGLRWRAGLCATGSGSTVAESLRARVSTHCNPACETIASSWSRLAGATLAASGCVLTWTDAAWAGLAAAVTAAGATITAAGSASRAAAGTVDTCTGDTVDAADSWICGTDDAAESETGEAGAMADTV